MERHSTPGFFPATLKEPGTAGYFFNGNEIHYYSHERLVAFRDQLDGLLEDRAVATPHQLELARQASRFLRTLQGCDTPAAKALESVGVPLIPSLYEGVMGFMADWAERKNREPGPPPTQPSADLKEALLAALRGYMTLHPSMGMEAASDLDEVFGENGEQAHQELDHLADYLALRIRDFWAVAVTPAVPTGAEPLGELARLRSRTLFANERLDAVELRVDNLEDSELTRDGHGERLAALEARLHALELHRQGLTDGQAEVAASAPLSTDDVEALTWAASVVAEAPLPIGDGPKLQRFLAMIGDGPKRQRFLAMARRLASAAPPPVEIDVLIVRLEDEDHGERLELTITGLADEIRAWGAEDRALNRIRLHECFDKILGGCALVTFGDELGEAQALRTEAAGLEARARDAEVEP